MLVSRVPWMPGCSCGAYPGDTWRRRATSTSHRGPRDGRVRATSKLDAKIAADAETHKTAEHRRDQVLTRERARAVRDVRPGDDGAVLGRGQLIHQLRVELAAGGAARASESRVPSPVWARRGRISRLAVRDADTQGSTGFRLEKEGV